MRHLNGLAVLVVFLACATTWGVGEAGEAGPKSTAEGNTAFALDLYARLRDTDGNVFFSPLSIRTALGMTCAGARGATAREMVTVLHLPEDRTRAHAEMGELIHLLNQLGKTKGCRLNIANALWGQKDYKFLDEFLVEVERHYGAGFGQVDFTREPEARKTINDWVAGKTEDKIKDLIQPGVIKPLTRLVLTNAIYFKGDWKTPFHERLTRDAWFFVTADKKTKVSTMSRTDEFGYIETDELQALEMPYAGDAVSMVVLLPRKRNGLAELEKDLTSANLAAWVGALRRQKVTVFLPRFKTEAEFVLNSTLSGMGMPLAFSDAADFSGMDGTHHLYISDVIHKACVEVNEKGTEAAAATAVVVTPKIEAPKAVPVFRADHPFVFLIRDRKTGSILFMGRVVDPTK